MKLSDAVATTSNKYHLGVNQRGQLELPVMVGDPSMKLRGLYQEKGLTLYYKPLP